MKKLIVTALAAFSLAACNDTTPDNPATLSVAPAGDVVFVAAGDSKTLEVTTNQSSWEVTLTPTDGNSWLSVSEKGADSFTLKAVKNTETTAPAAVTVTVKAGKAAPVTLTVTQLAAVEEPTLTTSFAGGTITFEAVGHQQGVQVTTNQPSWDVTLSPADGNGWLTLDEKEEGRFTLGSTKNTAPFARESVTVTVTAGDAAPVTIVCDQLAAAPQLGTNASDTIQFLATGGSETVTVTTNYTTWEITLDPTDGNGWLTLDSKDANGFTLKATENKESSEPAPVTVTVTAGDALPVTITVKQDAGDVVLTEYSVGDYWPDATNPVGVVWYIDPASSTDGGKTGVHGKIVSLDQTPNAVEWAGPNAYNLELSRDDGKANTDAIVKYAKDNDYTLNPLGAFQWCLSKGEGWYLPAFNEHKRLYATMSGVDYDTIGSWSDYSGMPSYNLYVSERSTFNAKFTDKEGTALYNAYFYWWSSTSNTNSYAWAFGNPNGTGNSQARGSNPGARARAMKAF